jgi:hypothetical protein
MHRLVLVANGQIDRQLQNPNAEFRNPKEARNPNSELFISGAE